MAFLLRCRPPLLLSLVAPSRRSFLSLTVRLSSLQSPEAFGLKPLRSVTRSIGSTRQVKAAVQPEGDSKSQFPRPSTVGYNATLANNINLIGSVGVNPDIKYLDNGTIVATSSLTVKRDPQGDPTWFFLEFKGDLAEIAAQHVRKADRVHVSGRISVEKVTDSGDVPQSLVKVEVADIHFVDDLYGTQAQPLPSKPRSASTSTGTPTEKRLAAEKMWKLFFSNPNDWYDNRDNKKNPRAPDFKHKTSGEALWIDSYYVPSNLKQQISDLEDQGLLKKVDGSKPVTTSDVESSGFSPY